MAPIGTSHHSVDNWCPDDSASRPRENVIKQQQRFLSQSRLAGFGRSLTAHNWNPVSSGGSVERSSFDFTERITQAMDTFFPLGTVKIRSNIINLVGIY